MEEGKMVRLDRRMANVLAKWSIVGKSDTPRLLAPALSWSEANLEEIPI